MRYTYFMEISRLTIFKLIRSIFFFDNLDESSIQNLTNRAKAAAYKNGEMIYEIHSNADTLFIVFKGQIKLESPDGVHSSSFLPGDMFGIEAAFPGSKRSARARSANDSILISISEAALSELMVEYPEIKMLFSSLYQSQQLSLKNQFTWLRPGENIRHISRKYFLPIFLPPIISLFIFTFFFITILFFQNNSIFRIFQNTSPYLFLVWFIWTGFLFLRWFFTFNVITNQRVLFCEKLMLVYDSIRETPLDAVLSVTWHTNVLGRLMKFGDVIARTYTSSLQLTSVRYPKFISQMLESEVRINQGEQKRAQKDSLADYLKKHLCDENTSSENSDYITESSDLITSRMREGYETLPLFVMSATINGNKYFRTHWFLLMKKLFLVLLFTIVLVTIYFIWAPIGWFMHLLFVSMFVLCFGAIMYQLVDWHNDLYIITHDQIVDIDRKPLGKEERRSALIRNIQAIEYKRNGILGLLLNFGTVYIRVGDAVLTFDEVHDPSKVQREISESFYYLTKSEKEKEFAVNRRMMAESIITYEEIKKHSGNNASGG